MPRDTFGLDSGDIAAAATLETALAPLDELLASLLDAREPRRVQCGGCLEPVLAVAVFRQPLRRAAPYVFVADLDEWLPRRRCHICAKVEARVNKDAPICQRCEGSGLKLATGVGRRARRTFAGDSRAGAEGGERLDCEACEGRGYIAVRRIDRSGCERCGGEGYVGSHRPPGELLAIDCAWSDEGHVRVIGEGTKRRRGEALHRPHACAA